MTAQRIYRAPSPYNDVELFEIDYVQSNDVLYLAHWDHAPGKLSRYGHTDWTFTTVTFGPSISAPTGLAATPVSPNATGGLHVEDATYIVTATDLVTGQESRGSATVSASNDLSLKSNTNTITWSAVTGAEYYTIYKSDSGALALHGYIGSTTGLSFIDNNINGDETDTPPQGRNPMDVAGNWPSTVALYDSRLVWGRTRNKPNVIYASQTASYENMDVSRPQRPDDAFTGGLVAERVNAVNQLIPMTDLLALCSDGLFKIFPGDTGGLASRRQAGDGSSRLDPIALGEVVLYRPNVGSSIQTLGFSFDIDGYRSNDVTIFSPHLFEKLEIVSWCYAKTPLSCVWAVLSSGQLACLTWELSQQVWGWTLCQTDGYFESVCSVIEDGEDRVYAIVRRTIEGIERKFIERMASAILGDIRHSCHLDSAVSYNLDTPATTFGLLDHLNGKTVDVLADGGVHKGLVVVGGQITLPVAASIVTIGLPYQSYIETLPLGLAIAGTMATKPQSISTVAIRVKDSRGLAIGPTDLPGEMYDVKDRRDEPYDTAPALFSGDHEVPVTANWTTRASIRVEQNNPLPFTVTGLFLDPKVSA